MLNFSKINIFYLFYFDFYFTFFDIKFTNWRKRYNRKKVNLGLDLQGGSYLLLEIDSDPLIKEKIQSKIIPFKKFLKDNELEYSNFEIGKNDFKFNLRNVDKFELLFFLERII